MRLGSGTTSWRNLSSSRTCLRLLPGTTAHAMVVCQLQLPASGGSRRALSHPAANSAGSATCNLEASRNGERTTLCLKPFIVTIIREATCTRSTKSMPVQQAPHTSRRGWSWKHGERSSGEPQRGEIVYMGLRRQVSIFNHDTVDRAIGRRFEAGYICWERESRCASYPESRAGWNGAANQDSRRWSRSNHHEEKGGRAVS